MSLDHSISQWISSLKEGDQEAARLLWLRYFHRLVALASRQLDQQLRRVTDEEDVALSVFRRLCLGAERQQFNELSDRDDLWSLLVTMTLRRIIDLHRREISQKRTGTIHDYDLSMIINEEPTPEMLTVMVEEQQRLFTNLNDVSLQRVAELKMSGCTNSEVARELGLTERSIERKLVRIRKCWASEIET